LLFAQYLPLHGQSVGTGGEAAYDLRICRLIRPTATFS
jgi:hypothetical protein